MSAVSRISSLRVSLTLLLLLALASLPFAHRATAQVQQDPAFIAFIQAGGTMSDLCDGPLEGQSHGALDCEACRIVNALILPSPAEVLLPRAALRFATPRVALALGAPRSPAGAPPPVRGPPFV
ncbi:polyketide synthase [Sulfitobacter sp. 1A15299]|uniref:polyketide synthase n=1 Tax=Sulfitobacter sp. 1A15299 TaxID=3368598 RepID=UPI003745EEBB